MLPSFNFSKLLLKKRRSIEKLIRKCKFGNTPNSRFKVLRKFGEILSNIQSVQRPQTEIATIPYHNQGVTQESSSIQ